MLKENYNLVEKDLNKLEDYSRYSIVDMIEISYMLSQREELNKLHEVYEVAFDGINTYGLFVKFVYDKFYKNTESTIDMALDNLDETIKEFKEKYYTLNLELGNKFFEKIIKTYNLENYEIVEDTKEYDNGLMLIIYNDKKHEEEISHICINLDNFNEEEM